MAREFQGVIITKENYRAILNSEGRQSINYHNKHLKAYLNGHDRFSHGKYVDGTTKWFPVLQKINLED